MASILQRNLLCLDLKCGSNRRQLYQDYKSFCFDCQTLFPPNKQKSNTMNRKALNITDNLKLCNYILENYKKSNLDDVKFSALATKDLNIEINSSHIATRRKALKINPNKSWIKNNIEKISTEKNQIKILEDKLKTLNDKFESLEKSVNHIKEIFDLE